MRVTAINYIVRCLKAVVKKTRPSAKVMAGPGLIHNILSRIVPAESAAGKPFDWRENEKILEKKTKKTPA
jgi:hypothetical protein